MSSDWKVEIVDANGDPDYSVTVIGDQVVDLTGAAAGDVLTVQGDGTVAPEDPHPAPTIHLVGAGGEPAFENGWENYGGAYEPAAFWEDAFGVVHLEGLLKSGAGVAFTLPVEFRPSWDVLVAVDTNGAFGEARITASTGGVLITGATYTALSGITFRAA